MALNLDWGLLDRPRPALRATSSPSPAVQSIPDLLYLLFEKLSKKFDFNNKSIYERLKRNYAMECTHNII